VCAYVGLGANLGDPVAQLHDALHAMGAIAATRVSRVSSFYRTAPVGYAGQPDFINAVAELETGLDARALLDELAAIE
jgi:2-amino-4-hydroxy-6-hydroxymethyldihydropteridine diphosphokinase